MFKLSPLPFKKNALEPYISTNTIEYHYNKHHQSYVSKLNKLVVGTDLENDNLENIILKTKDGPKQLAIFNNAAQIFNHTFFWNSLCPAQQNIKISKELSELIKISFGSFEKFIEEFKIVAMSQFGSGWIWLIKREGLLEIMKTSNADNPLTHNVKPLLTIDVWEHAYYLDYQNRRDDFIEVVIDNLLNWDFASHNL